MLFLITFENTIISEKLKALYICSIYKHRYVKIYCTYTKIKGCMQKYIHVQIPVSYHTWEYPVIIHYNILVLHFLLNMSNDWAHLICSHEEPHTKKTFHQTFLTFLWRNNETVATRAKWPWWGIQRNDVLKICWCINIIQAKLKVVVAIL